MRLRATVVLPLVLVLAACGKSAPAPAPDAAAPPPTETQAPPTSAPPEAAADAAPSESPEDAGAATTAAADEDAAATAAANEDATAAAPKGDAMLWAGAVTAPGGMELGIEVALAKNADGAWSGTISIPMQNVKDHVLDGVAADDHALAFTLKLPGMPEAAWAKFTATLAEDGKTAAGTLHQGGLDLPLKLERTTAEALAASAPKRPQMPAPPFPYTVREVSFKHPTTGATLAGTITAPADDAKHAAAVLITGSGLQDRDETIFGHKPFLVLADWLTRHGVVVLRVDDRGVGGSTGDAESATVLDNATDVEAAFRFLREQPEVDPAKVGLIGHSEGGIIAPVVASRVPEVAFVVALAGTGMTGEELIPLQYALMAKAEGVADTAVAATLALEKAAIAAAAKGEPRDVVKTAVKALVAAQSPEIAGVSKEELESDAFLDRAVDQLLGVWFLSFLRLDPKAYWKQVKCPVLAVGGSLDMQVPAEENLALIAAAVKEGGNEDVTTMTLPSLNHLFQTATTGGLSEYATIEETFAPTALELLSTWIAGKTGGAAPEK
ncbi:MAG: alpha/beta hydrolase [Myxococcales bacterium]|nr:alpha/beta hydrolase [Myxococcales bacterium]